MENEKFEFAIEFADYLNNNWYVPTTDGFWKIDVENDEYTLDVPELNLFSTKELLVLFIAYLDKIEANKSEEEKVDEYIERALKNKPIDRVITDVSVHMSYKTKHNNFLEKVMKKLNEIKNEN